MKDLTRNPFLLLGASTDTAMTDIRSEAQMEMMRLKLSGDDASQRQRLLEGALDTLQDNAERFHWGLLWLELSSTEAARAASDPVLSTLVDDPAQDGFDAYEKICDSDSLITRAHNLGVLGLLEAQVKTEIAQLETVDDISDDLACATLWKRAFTTLRFALNSDEFWMRRRIWAKSLDDPRLNERCVEQFRLDLPKEILQYPGAVIRQALLDRHSEVAKVYVDVVRESGYDDSSIDDSLSMVYAPLADRVRDAVGSLKERLEQLSGESDDINDYRQLIYEFKAVVAPDLDVMLAVGDLPGYAEEHARDTSSDFLRSLSTTSWNATTTTELSNEAIELAMSYVDSESLGDLLVKDSDKIHELATAVKTSKKLAPYREKFEQAMARKDFAAATASLDKLIDLEEEPTKSQAIKLQTQLHSAWAAKLCDEAFIMAQMRNFPEAEAKLRQALSVAPLPSEQMVIKKLISKIQSAGFSSDQSASVSSGSGSSGCLGILVAGLFIGFTTGAVYAFVW